MEFYNHRAQELIVDESEPLGTGQGPNPAGLLSAAVGHCVSSSRVYCPNRARVGVEGLETRVKAELVKCKQGYWRIAGIGVRI